MWDPRTVVGMSMAPSQLRSAAAMWVGGQVHVRTFVDAPWLSRPVCWNTETYFVLIDDVARSIRPSPLKSATVMETGALPTAKFVVAPNPPAPFPGRIETQLDPVTSAARSGR